MRYSLRLVPLFSAIFFYSASSCATSALAQDTGFGGKTRLVIEKIKSLAANDEVLAGDPASAKKRLAELQAPLKDLEDLAERFRELANREHDRCGTSIEQLEKRTSELYREQEEIDRKLHDLNAELARQTSLESSSKEQIAALNSQLGATLAAIQERKRKLEEVNKWWWVPGYGQYLAIKSLVDDDIQQFKNLASTLEDQKLQMSQAGARIGAAQDLVERLESEKRMSTDLNKQLAEMRSSAQDNLRSLKSTAIFLTDSEVFWGKAQSLLQQNGSDFLATMKLLQELLVKNTRAPGFNEPQSNAVQEEVRQFEDTMMSFADSVDNHTNFLLDEKTGYCGGPPRGAANVSEKCNIEQFTKFYEIIDPKSCIFRYLDPPGCPPSPRERPDSVQTSVTASREGWSWANDENWVGRARCNSAGAFYFGKLNSAGECEKKCLADSECTFWTFNRNNGYMPDSINECWGGSGALKANKGSWGGFVSGGPGL